MGGGGGGNWVGEHAELDCQKRADGVKCVMCSTKIGLGLA